jgi:hypothetical protein
MVMAADAAWSRQPYWSASSAPRAAATQHNAVEKV